MSLPSGFTEKYQQLLGAEAAAFLATFDEPAQSGFRINPLHPSAPALPKPIAWSQWGSYGKVAGTSIAHLAGDVYSQEPSAQFVAAVLAPTPGDRVLDLCAAPGGKTTQLGSFMAQQGLLVANEINAGRARVLSSNVERFGLTNTLVTNSDPQSLAAQLPEFFDRILVDAPCSGEGMFRKDPGAMAYWNPDYPAQCATRQREILRSAVGMLRPGGTLVYSTCTFSPEEDEQIIAWAAQELELSIEPIAKVGGITDGQPDWADGNPELTNTARLWPHLLQGEGHFVAKLRKAGDAPARTRKLQAAARLSRTEQADLTAFTRSSMTAPIAGPFLKVGDNLTTMPAAMPALAHIHVLRAGLDLGTFKKGRFEPSHALATALPASAFQTVVPLTAEEFDRYRHGETVARPTLKQKQTVLLTYEGAGFALGKLVNGTIKNAYPKGLRK